MAKKRLTPVRDSVMFPRPTRVPISKATPEQLKTLAAAERHRVDFLSRLKKYMTICGVEVAQHYGARPSHISEQAWADLEWRFRHIDLPNDAPGSAYDALLALRHAQRVVDILTKVNNWPDELDVAFCELIDFGKLLQRMDDRKFESDVRTGQPVNANLSRTRKASTRSGKNNRDRIRREVQALMEQTPGLNKTSAGQLLSERIEKELNAAGLPRHEVRQAMMADGRLVASLRTIKSAIAGWTPRIRRSA